MPLHLVHEYMDYKPIFYLLLVSLIEFILPKNHLQHTHLQDFNFYSTQFSIQDFKISNKSFFWFCVSCVNPHQVMRQTSVSSLSSGSWEVIKQLKCTKNNHCSWYPYRRTMESKVWQIVCPSFNPIVTTVCYTNTKTKSYLVYSKYRNFFQHFYVHITMLILLLLLD